MSRLNLTLPEAATKALRRHAKGRPVARVARELIEAGLAREAKLAWLQRLARDYAQGREDALELLADFDPLAAGAVGHERD
jgi:hypothetical protein